MKYEYWFAVLKGISANRKYELRQKIKDASELFYMEETKLRRLGMTEKEAAAVVESRSQPDIIEVMDKKLCAAVEKQIRLVRRGTKDYPKRLEYIDAPPYMLYVKGQLLRGSGLVRRLSVRETAVLTGKHMPENSGSVLRETVCLS